MRAVIVPRVTGYSRRMRHVIHGVWIAGLCAALSADTALAQVRGDTTKAAAPVRRARAVTRLAPPLSPRRAFLYSFVLPGFGQSRLDRGTSGALFASVELAAFVMVRRSTSDLREVQRYRIDTLPSDFVVAGDTLTKTGGFTNRYSADLEKTRRLHVEDWLAVLAFNHLFAGADAFVAAQLWDVPVSLAVTPHGRGVRGVHVVATIRW